ncbi:hypothetical protein WP12_10510 [Sphingomonas sp. SRS2]|nr:hypothetical protein WP12_10510 [Sphingomonas sp. SRS2]
MSAATTDSELELTIENLRSVRGFLLVCLTQNERHFPDCKGDPKAARKMVQASKEARVVFMGLPPGRYALSLIHDENGNGKLDTALGIPREGFGFSRNPTIRFGPPRFDEVIFTFAGGKEDHAVRLRYIL